MVVITTKKEIENFVKRSMIRINDSYSDSMRRDCGGLGPCNIFYAVFIYRVLFIDGVKLDYLPIRSNISSISRFF